MSKPWKYYFNISKHFAKHRQDKLLAATDESGIIKFDNIGNHLGAVLAGARINLGNNLQFAAGERIGTFHISYYCILRQNRAAFDV